LAQISFLGTVGICAVREHRYFSSEKALKEVQKQHTFLSSLPGTPIKPLQVLTAARRRPGAKDMKENVKWRTRRAECAFELRAGEPVSEVLHKSQKEKLSPRQTQKQNCVIWF
jgi:hypothetical protein